MINDLAKILFGKCWPFYGFIGLLITCSCKETKRSLPIDNLSKWEFKMVSRGSNQPNFDTTKDSIHYIPILLHTGHTVDEIRARFGWSEAVLNNKLELLVTNGFLQVQNKTYTPSVMILSDKAAQVVRSDLKPIAEQIVGAILKNKDSIVKKTTAISCFQGFTMKDLSLLVFSNILLDNGQLKNVEDTYLRSARPERNGGNYYASYQEKVTPDFEALGIYGNHVQVVEGFVLCRYGNQRYIKEVEEMNAQILQKYKNLQEGMAFGYPVITSECNAEIQALADYFKPYLIAILRSNDAFLRTGFKGSIYAKNVSYEEYFMWVYHILYSQVTDALVAAGEITIPPEKVSFYVYQP